MALEKVVLNFANGFNGVMSSPKGDILIGQQANGQRPYNLLFGALGSCFYATFLAIVEKKRLTLERASVEVTGVKKDEAKMLESALITLIIKGPCDKEKMLRSAELGAKHCSIHALVSQGAKVDLVVKFE